MQSKEMPEFYTVITVEYRKRKPNKKNMYTVLEPGAIIIADEQTYAISAGRYHLWVRRK